jgi:ArsR family transcriptional regulator
MMVDIAPFIEVCQYTPMANSSPCCLPVLQTRLGRRNAEELATAFRALADPARLCLLSFIAAQPEGEACVCHLTAPTGLSQPTVSHHLKILNEAGLLDRERRGTWVYYRLVPERLEALRAALAAPKRTAIARRA